MTDAPGSRAYPTLFSPLAVKGMHIRNRIVLPPMATVMDLTGEQGYYWYIARAKGGAGLIILEGTSTYKFRRPEFVEGLRRIVAGIHDRGSVAAIQLFQVPETPDGKAVAPSSVDDTPTATEAELQEMLDWWERAAGTCKDIGFDSVEPHGAHGFFFNQFFSPIANQRDDAYGGDLQRRMRFGLDVVERCRKATGGDYPMLYRHTPAQDDPSGYTLEDSIAFCKELVRAGVDVLDISPSTSPEGEHCDHAAAIREATQVPVIAVGKMENPATAEAALVAGKCDLVAIGRSLIADAFLPEKVLHGREDDVIECVKCDEMCFGNLAEGIPIGCAQNAKVGLEYKEPELY